MLRCTSLVLGLVFCGSAGTAQVSPAIPESASNKSESKAGVHSAAEAALDAAKRWTEAALTDSSNLLPLERDILLARIAAAWKDADHQKAEQYLNTALAHLNMELKRNGSQYGQAPFAGTFISSDVMAVDRNAWNSLIDQLPPRYASEAIADQAQDLANDDDLASASELEKKSLALGGSERDYNTIEFFVDSDVSAASNLFDELLNTAAKPDSNPELFLELVRHVFNDDQDDDSIRSFYNQERQQRILDLLSQKVIAGKEQNDCSSYAGLAATLLSRFQSATQQQLQAIVTDCHWRLTGTTQNVESEKLNTTDDMVQAMNAAPEVKVKWQLRQQAADHAARVDQDYARAVQICLDTSEQEREYMTGAMSFEAKAASYAYLGIRAALKNDDDVGFRRILGLLPERLRAQSELDAIQFMAKENKPQALLLLNQARDILDRVEPLRDDSYFTLLRMTDSFDPKDLELTWRVVINGLNRFEQAQRTSRQGGVAVSSNETQPLFRDPLYPWFVPKQSLADEGFVRACVDDLSSPIYRARIRTGAVASFLARYSDALKEAPAKPANTAAAAKN